MPLRINTPALELPDEYEICFKDKQKEVNISAPNKDDAKELFTFALTEAGMK